MHWGIKMILSLIYEGKEVGVKYYRPFTKAFLRIQVSAISVQNFFSIFQEVLNCQVFVEK